MDDLNGRITHTKFCIRKQGRLEGLKSVDPALLSLIGEEFKFGDHSVRLFFELGTHWQVSGQYHSVANNSMRFYNGTFCGDPHMKSGAVIRFVCSNFTKLLSFASAETCRWEGVLVTPAVCSEADAQGFEDAPVERLRLIAARMGVVYAGDTPQNETG
jgi:hypothetical protein